MCFKVIYRSTWTVGNKNNYDRIDALQCEKKNQKRYIDEIIPWTRFHRYLVILPATLLAFRQSGSQIIMTGSALPYMVKLLLCRMLIGRLLTQAV